MKILLSIVASALFLQTNLCGAVRTKERGLMKGLTKGNGGKKKGGKMKKGKGNLFPCFPNKTTLSNAVDAIDSDGIGHTYEANSVNYGNIEDWCFDSAITSMSAMFLNAASFNADISKWNVASVTDMNHMFYGAASFNADISKWNVAGVTDMNHMFGNTALFNADIGKWKVESVTNMSHMFFNAALFNADIGKWKVASVMNMSGMFFNAASFNAYIGKWKVASVTNMSNMFYSAEKFNQNLCDWGPRMVQDSITGSMFVGTDCESKAIDPAPPFDKNLCKIMC